MSAFVVAGATMLACGGDGASGPAVDSCLASCDAQRSATGCTETETAVSICKAFCNLVVPMMDADCKGKVMAQYDCTKSQTYHCGSGGNLPLLDDDQACAAELQTAMPCLQGTKP
ncbi:MAG: hypothetical protein KC503_33100 [Myxococcales bacterium]|nr:hypothetical protein [Myxococcales bacterium]